MNADSVGTKRPSMCRFGRNWWTRMLCTGPAYGRVTGASIRTRLSCSTHCVAMLPGDRALPQTCFSLPAFGLPSALLWRAATLTDWGQTADSVGTVFRHYGDKRGQCGDKLGTDWGQSSDKLRTSRGQCANTMGSSRDSVGTNWGQTGNRLWSNWGQLGDSVQTSWGQAGTVWGQTENRLGTNWGQRGDSVQTL